jgi:hypothetical protein
VESGEWRNFESERKPSSEIRSRGERSTREVREKSVCFEQTQTSLTRLPRSLFHVFTSATYRVQTQSPVDCDHRQRICFVLSLRSDVSIDSLNAIAHPKAARLWATAPQQCRISTPPPTNPTSMVLRVYRVS